MLYYQWNFGDNEDCQKAFDQWLRKGNVIKSFSFSKNGIIALFDNGHWGWTEVTRKLDDKLRGRQIKLPSPTIVHTDNGNRYFIQFANGECKWRASRSFSNVINSVNKNEVADVAFARKNGWCIIFNDGSCEWNSLPLPLHTLLEEKQRLEINIKYLSISQDDYWFVSYCNGTYDVNLPPKCRKAFDSLTSDGSIIIHRIWLGKYDVFCIAYEISGERITLSPWQISFSKVSILPHFTNGSSIWIAICDLEKGSLNSNFFPPIRIVRRNNAWITFDDRCLFIFQNGGVDLIDVIVVKTCTKTLSAHRSVKVVPCVCSKCSFAKYIPWKKQNSSNLRKNNQYVQCSNWSWKLFVENKKPMLLTKKLILPWIKSGRENTNMPIRSDLPTGISINEPPKKEKHNYHEYLKIINQFIFNDMIIA